MHNCHAACLGKYHLNISIVISYLLVHESFDY